MKYSVKNSGKIDLGAKATDNVTSVISGFWNKIIGIVNKKDDSNNKVEKPESGFFANGTINWEIEASAEISVEEMTEIFKLSKENDLHMWDLLKTMGNDLLKGTGAVLNALKEQGPEWIKTIRSLEDLDDEISTASKVKSIKRHNEAENEMVVKREAKKASSSKGDDE